MSVILQEQFLKAMSESWDDDYCEEKYSLVGQDGNAFALMGYTARCMKECGLRDEIKEMQARATSGDYYNLINVCDEYVQRCNDIACGLDESLNKVLNEGYYIDDDSVINTNTDEVDATFNVTVQSGDVIFRIKPKRSLSDDEKKAILRKVKSELKWLANTGSFGRIYRPGVYGRFEESYNKKKKSIKESFGLPGKRYDFGVEFEKFIPHNMRYKEYDFIKEGDKNVLYWITQETFSDDDLDKFEDALANQTDFDSAYVVLRDDSTYIYHKDKERKAGKEITNPYADEFYMEESCNKKLKESMSGFPPFSDVIDWLYTHEQAYSDCCDFFGVNDLENEADEDEVMSWIYDNDMLLQDFIAQFGEDAIMDDEARAYFNQLDESLTEANWNYTLKCGNALRQAIDDGDAEEVINQLWAGYKELLDAEIIDDMDYESYTDDLIGSEYWEAEEWEDNVDWALDNFYDLCDNTRVWIPLMESYEQPIQESLWDLVKGYLEEDLDESIQKEPIKESMWDMIKDYLE